MIEKEKSPPYGGGQSTSLQFARKWQLAAQIRPLFEKLPELIFYGT